MLKHILYQKCETKPKAFSRSRVVRLIAIGRLCWWVLSRMAVENNMFKGTINFGQIIMYRKVFIILSPEEIFQCNLQGSYGRFLPINYY